MLSEDLSIPLCTRHTDPSPAGLAETKMTPNRVVRSNTMDVGRATRARVDRQVSVGR